MDNPYQAPADRSSPAETRAGPRDRKRRPTSATFFGVVNVAIGSLEVLWAPFVLIALFEDFVRPSSLNPPARTVAEQESQTILMVTTPLGAIAAGLMFASGIGLLGAKPWGRTLALAYAYLALLLALADAIPRYLYRMQPALAALRDRPDPQMLRVVIASGVAMFFNFTYPVLLHVFLARPSVARALAPPVRKVPGSDWDFTLPSKRT